MTVPQFRTVEHRFCPAPWTTLHAVPAQSRCVFGGSEEAGDEGIQDEKPDEENELRDVELNEELRDDAEEPGENAEEVGENEEDFLQSASLMHWFAPGPFTVWHVLFEQIVWITTPQPMFVMHSFCAMPATYVHAAPTHARCWPLAPGR